MKNRVALNNKNKGLLQKVKDQKAKVLKIKNALTYKKDQLAKLQTNQNARSQPFTCTLSLSLDSS